MSYTQPKEPEPPCLGVGCGDNLRTQLGAEKRALLFSRQPKSPCRRPQYRRETSVPKPALGDLKKTRKASSLEDLSPRRQEQEIQQRRHRPMQISSPTLRVMQANTKTALNTSFAARKVCHYLLLNAWRHRRDQVQQYTITAHHLESQVENLNIQVIVLRRLLESEKERVSHANSEVQQMVAQVEDSVRVKETIKQEKEDLEKKIEKLKDIISEMQTKCQNIKNDFLATRSVVMALEMQLGKERDKLLKLREDKKHLLEKMHTKEEQASSLQSSVKDLEGKLVSVQEKHRQAETQGQEAKKAVKQLENRCNKLQAQVKNMTDNNQELQLSLNDKQLQIVGLQEQLEYSWSSRAIGIASLIARIPLSILHNMVFIFLPQEN